MFLKLNILVCLGDIFLVRSSLRGSVPVSSLKRWSEGTEVSGQSLASVAPLSSALDLELMELG